MSSKLRENLLAFVYSFLLTVLIVYILYYIAINVDKFNHKTIEIESLEQKSLRLQMEIDSLKQRVR